MRFAKLGIFTAAALMTSSFAQADTLDLVKKEAMLSAV